MVEINSQPQEPTFNTEHAEGGLENFYDIQETPHVLLPGHEYTMPAVTQASITIEGNFPGVTQTFEFWNNTERNCIEILEVRSGDTTPIKVGEIMGREGVLPIGRKKGVTSDVGENGLVLPYGEAFQNVSRNDGRVLMVPGFGENGADTFTLTYERNAEDKLALNCKFESRRLKEE